MSPVMALSGLCQTSARLSAFGCRVKRTSTSVEAEPVSATSGSNLHEIVVQ
jgi:hypothetical protein